MKKEIDCIHYKYGECTNKDRAKGHINNAWKLCNKNKYLSSQYCGFYESKNKNYK